MSMSQLMKAVLLTGHGGMDQLEHRDDVPVPVPGSGEVLIEVSACGMNNTDIKVREAQYTVDHDPNGGQDESASAASISSADGATSLSFPRIQGGDIVGRIVKVGAGVDSCRIDQRVLVDFSIYHGRDEQGQPTMDLANVDYIGHGCDGGYAEYVVVPAANAHHVTRAISDAELATFGCATVTAEHMLSRIQLSQGQLVIITGAGGGVGSAAVQLARARGARPIALTSRGKEDAILALGAETCLCRDEYTDPEGIFQGAAFLAGIERAAGGKHRIDAVIDQVGGTMFHSLLQTLKPDGHYITAGTIAGYTPRVNLHTVYMAFLNIHGSSQGTPADFRRIVEYIEQGSLQPVLGGTFPLSQLVAAQNAFQTKRHVGNLVIVPDSKWDIYGAPHAA